MLFFIFMRAESDSWRADETKPDSTISSKYIKRVLEAQIKFPPVQAKARVKQFIKKHAVYVRHVHGVDTR